MNNLSYHTASHHASYINDVVNYVVNDSHLFVNNGAYISAVKLAKERLLAYCKHVAHFGKFLNSVVYPYIITYCCFRSHYLVSNVSVNPVNICFRFRRYNYIISHIKEVASRVRRVHCSTWRENHRHSGLSVFFPTYQTTLQQLFQPDDPIRHILHPEYKAHLSFAHQHSYSIFFTKIIKCSIK